ncbi:MAG: DUF2585 family protein [Candidatus Yanofskybacteria bacterium]|nr:DUF2585 family protein [Candidatus Yanofskybacteria bacterium]
MPQLEKLSTRNYIFISIGILVVFAVTLHLMGQIWICKCGYVKLWHGVTYSSENSQHLTDWYTFSHIIHGFGFYLFAWLLSKKWKLSVWQMFLMALLVEVSWELFENTDFVINRYREVTISLDYYGDSVINSVFDVLAMTFGFWLAYRLPVLMVIALTVAMELWVGYSIRDNLTLNIIMLIHPSQAILNWQSGG